MGRHVDPALAEDVDAVGAGRQAGAQEAGRSDPGIDPEVGQPLAQEGLGEW